MVAEWLDAINLWDVLVMFSIGFEMEINDGHITGIIDDERRRFNLCY